MFQNVVGRCARVHLGGRTRGSKTMNKREIIDHIRELNTTAQPDFLADFAPEDLLAYLHQLQEVERDRTQRQTDHELVCAG